MPVKLPWVMPAAQANKRSTSCRGASRLGALFFGERNCRAAFVDLQVEQFGCVRRAKKGRILSARKSRPAGGGIGEFDDLQVAGFRKSGECWVVDADFASDCEVLGQSAGVGGIRIGVEKRTCTKTSRY